MRQRSVLATVHVADRERLRVERVVLDRPPVATVSEVEAVMHGWWYRAGGYPVGRRFGTAVEDCR